MPELRHLRNTCSYADAKVRVAALAQHQWGVVSHAQLVDSGLSRTVMRRWIQDRRLFRLHPGVYAVGHPALGIEGERAAALFYAGPGSALCGVTAGMWLGIHAARLDCLHVCTPTRRRSLRGVRVHCRREFERVWHNRLPVTPPAQTLLDIAGQIRFQELRRALSEAEYLKLVTLEEVVQVLGRGKPGSAALRAAVDLHNPRLARTRRGLEERFLLLRERYALTPPDGVNVWVEGWLVDAVWYEQKVIVELDSRTAHSSSRSIERDHQRDLELRAAGYTVLRYTWQQITQTPELVVADLLRHGVRPLAARAAL